MPPGFARITLHRPEKRNALDEELVGEVQNALALSSQDGNVRVVLLTGAGQDFCAGAEAGVEMNAIARLTDDFKASIERFRKKS